MSMHGVSSHSIDSECKMCKFTQAALLKPSSKAFYVHYNGFNNMEMLKKNRALIEN